MIRSNLGSYDREAFLDGLKPVEENLSIRILLSST